MYTQIFLFHIKGTLIISKMLFYEHKIHIIKQRWFISILSFKINLQRIPKLPDYV